MALQNVFSWSKSRDEQFRECARKYFYDKYASWGGWDARAPKEARLAYIYKNLKNRWAWKGESVHHTIENVLKAIRVGKAMAEAEALQALTEQMRLDYKSSKTKKYFDDPKKSVGLFEHEYEKDVSDDTWKKIHDESVQCLRKFFRSQLYQELLIDDKKSWLLIEDLEEFDFEGAKIYVKLDFCRKKGDIIEIYDWKTGKISNQDFDVQMGAYALYAMGKWGIPLEKVRAFILNLTPDLPVAEEQVLTPFLLDQTKEVMKKSIQEMQAMLDDVLRNIPKKREVFKFTENTRICDSCNFYKICEKYT